jgi:hypothetical protein
MTFKAFIQARPHLLAGLIDRYGSESAVCEVMESAFDEIRSEALAGERERVAAHIALGRASGHIDVAIDAVLDGSTVDAMRPRYMQLAMRKGGFQGAALGHLLSGEGSS